MSEQITTIAELDAKSALMTKLCRVLGRDHVDAVHLDLVSALAGDDLWPLMMSFAASRRPDAPARTDDEFRVEYLCVLDPGCGGREHSVSCQELNERRRKALINAERRRRRGQIENELRALES